MAVRRMISREVICSDDFVEMSFVSQALYYQMLINADDDGFVSNPKQITRSIGATQEAMQELLDNKFVLQFNAGIIVIRHWLSQNKVQADRYKPTKFMAERELLSVNGAKEYFFDDK